MFNISNTVLVAFTHLKKHFCYSSQLGSFPRSFPQKGSLPKYCFLKNASLPEIWSAKRFEQFEDTFDQQFHLHTGFVFVGKELLSIIDAVDGRNLAPPGMYENMKITGYLPYEVVHDFFHQHY